MNNSSKSDDILKKYLNLDDSKKEKIAKKLKNLFPDDDPKLRCNECNIKKPKLGWEVIYMNGECYCSNKCYSKKYDF